jgi:hypothetical protein
MKTLPPDTEYDSEVRRLLDLAVGVQGAGHIRLEPHFHAAADYLR